MKFQNCILSFEWMHGWMDRVRQKDGWTNPKQYAPSTFPKLGEFNNEFNMINEKTWEHRHLLQGNMGKF